MPDISLSGVHAADFIDFGMDQVIPEGAYAMVPLARVLDDPSVLDVAGKLAVLVPGDGDAKEFAPFINQLAAVVIDFPVFSDGRGFSLSHRLRRDLGFKGEIRAVGHVIPDQAHFLARSGFDTATVSEERLPAFERAKSRFPAFYQCTINGDMSVAHRRHGDGTTACDDKNAGAA